MQIKRELVEQTNHRGISCPRPEVWLDVFTKPKNEPEQWLKVLFIVDTGADVTCIPIPVANELGIPFKRSTNPKKFRTASGQVIGHRGQMIININSKQFTWTCYFTEASQSNSLANPSPPKKKSSKPKSENQWLLSQMGIGEHTCLLGRADVLSRDFDFHMNKTHFKLTSRNESTFKRTIDFFRGLFQR